jgi:hypothetical protein
VYVKLCVNDLHVYVYVNVGTKQDKMFWKHDVDFYIYAYTHTYIHTYLHTYRSVTTNPADVKELIPELLHTCIHTYIHTYIYTHRSVTTNPADVKELIPELLHT